MTSSHPHESEDPVTLRASVERLMSPGYGWCFHCGRPWKFVKGHSTPYMPSRSCFPLCEGCWAELETPDARMPYYRMLWNNWLTHGPPHCEWEDIERAVLAGR